MTTVTLYAKLPEWSGIKAHEMRNADPKRLADAMIYTTSKECHSSDVLLVGEAEITVKLYEPEQFAAQAVRNLRKQQAKVRADAEIKANAIEQQIQKLLAISYSSETA